MTDEQQDNSPGGLDPRDLAVLDFERDWQVWEGRKEAEISDRFGFSAARYYQLLNRLLDDPGAQAYDPLLILRLRRRREERARRGLTKASEGPRGR